jgi:hypothetical protein
VFICNDIKTLARDGKLRTMGYVIKKYNPEVLMVSANWQFNWDIPTNTIDSCFKNIRSLQVGLFSCTSHYCYGRTRKEKLKYDNFGTVGVEWGRPPPFDKVSD